MKKNKEIDDLKEALKIQNYQRNIETLNLQGIKNGSKWIDAVKSNSITTTL